MEPRSQKGNAQNWVICWQESSRKLCFCPASPGYCRRTITIPGGLPAEPIWGRVPWDIGRQWWASLWNGDLGGLRGRWHAGLWRFYSNAGHFSFKIISVSSRDCLKLLLLIPVSYLCSEVKHHKVGVNVYVCMWGSSARAISWAVMGAETQAESPEQQCTGLCCSLAPGTPTGWGSEGSMDTLKGKLGSGEGAHSDGGHLLISTTQNRKCVSYAHPRGAVS